MAEHRALLTCEGGGHDKQVKKQLNDEFEKDVDEQLRGEVRLASGLSRFLRCSERPEESKMIQHASFPQAFPWYPWCRNP